MIRPVLSIAICTYNNAESLEKTLSDLGNQSHIDSASVEVVIIDNNSSDGTAAIIREFESHFSGKVTGFFEARQGLSTARNLAIAKARGQYILFTDDDASLPRDWTQKYLYYIEKFQPDCLYSRISVEWGGSQPWWYTSRYRPYFVELDYGDEIIQIEDVHHEFFGKNFAIKSTLLIAMGGFNESLGRKGSSLVAGEETLIYRSLIRDTRSVLYFPDGAVGHRLKPREYTTANIRKAFIDSAKTDYFLSRSFSRYLLFRRPIGLAARATIRYFGARAKYLQMRLRNSSVEGFYYNLLARKQLELLKLIIKNG